MAAFFTVLFALLAGLVIGVILAAVLFAVSIDGSEPFRKYIVEACEEARADKQIRNLDI